MVGSDRGHSATHPPNLRPKCALGGCGRGPSNTTTGAKRVAGTRTAGKQSKERLRCFESVPSRSCRSWWTKGGVYCELSAERFLFKESDRLHRISARESRAHRVGRSFSPSQTSPDRLLGYSTPPSGSLGSHYRDAALHQVSIGYASCMTVSRLRLPVMRKRTGLGLKSQAASSPQ